MPQGIVIKIWNIKEGSQNRSGADQISDSIDYITNSEKCDYKIGKSGTSEKCDDKLIDMQQQSSAQASQSQTNFSQETSAQLGRELTYVSNDIKTLKGLYVGCRQISDLKHAVDEMMQVKEYYGKTGGRVALHGIISLDRTESDQANAGKLMFLLDDLLKEVFPQHQAVYAVHTNTENLHIHFIVNTVGLDGKKIHMDQSFMRKVMEPAVNRLAVKYGFTPNEHWRANPLPEKMSYRDQKILLRNLVNQAIEEAEFFQDFVRILKEEGLTVNVGKHISLQAEGMSRAMRTGQLGENYSLEMIQNRIVSKKNPLHFVSVQEHVSHSLEEDRYHFALVPIKKYKDLTMEEQQAVIHMLREGRNPWQENYLDNWRLQSMSDRLSRTAYIADLQKAYGYGNGTLQALKDEIIKRQKELSAEKKAVRKVKLDHKALFSLYEEMKGYEIRSYLYQHGNCREYQADHLKFLKLSERMWKLYEKRPDQVAGYLEHLESQLLYARAQYEELSDQYKAILRYEKEQKKDLQTEQEMSLFDAIGFSRARTAFRQYGIVENSLKFIGIEDQPDRLLRVETGTALRDGKLEMACKISVITTDGEVLQEFSSGEMELREFYQRIRELAVDYGIETCRASGSMEEALSSGRN